MPNTREKLIELITEAKSKVDRICVERDWCDGCPVVDSEGACRETYIADHLIANGVTVQEWISVKDRLPEDVYGKDREQIVVLVCTKSGKVSQCARMADYECIADETLTKVEWIKNGKFYWSKNKAVTHWMPLPMPPKGE